MDIRARDAIAGRIRGLIAGQDDTPGDAALRMGVDEVALRMSIDVQSPYPTIDVLAAVIRHYGVDPTWLLTGRYNEITHHGALEASTGELAAAVEAIVAANDQKRSFFLGRSIRD